MPGPAKSYAERLFSFERVERLPTELARDAIVTPAAEEGVVWEPAAVDLVVDATQGYPYFLQQSARTRGTTVTEPTS